MCSRYQSASEAEMGRAFDIDVRLPKGSSFKPLIFPGYQAPILIEIDGEVAVQDRFWGLIARFPGKKEPGKMLEKIMQNAVSETIDEKRTFKSLWNNGQRCLIPAKTFLEPKEKVFTPIHDPKKEILVMAGIFGETTFKEKKRDAFTMLTCEPNSFMEPFHDRMPVILEPDDWQEWLSPDTPPDQALKLCKPYRGMLTFAKES